MVLLDKLINEKQKIIVAHVNYQKRIDSYLDSVIIKEYLKDKKDVIFEEKIVKKEEYTNANFEAEARQIRYNFFIDLYNKYKATAIYVAHHRDDYLETYIFKKQRKGLYDYYGIKEKTYYKDCLIIRPLINLYKEDLMEYAIKYNIPYHEDSTNLEFDYTRNVIRASLNKLTKKEKEKLFEDAQLLNKEVEKENKNIEKFKDKSFIKIDDFNLLNQNEKRRLLFYIIKKYDISTKNIDEIIRKIIYSKNFKQSFLNTTILKAYDTIYITNKEFENYIYFIYSKKDAINFANIIKNLFNYDIILEMDNYPFLIRNYQLEDFDNLKIDYQSYRNKLKKDKIPFFLRDWMPVVEKNNKVVSLIKFKR